MNIPLGSKLGCRLCGGATEELFTAQVLGRHQVCYMRCQSCGSLQTERPYWLPEAYSLNLSSLDTGAAQRGLRNMAACYAIARLYGLRQLLDIGGGDGLLCRLLRDQRLNCFVRDQYAHPTYAQGFDLPDFEVPEMVTAFEVVEHLADPAAELPALFSGEPAVVLISTEVYSGQDAGWWYVAPETGQHVFFYSAQALGLVAKRFGYTMVRGGEFTLFVARRLSGGWRQRLAGLLLRRRVLRLVAARLMLSSAPGVVEDFKRGRARAATRSSAT